MIPASRILRLVRKKSNDMNEVRFSDYDVADALNECIRYVNQSLALKSSEFLERIKAYRQREINAEIAEYNETAAEGEKKESVDFARTGAALPEDFLVMVSVIRARDGYHLSPIPAGEQFDCRRSETFGGYKVFAGRIYTAWDFDLCYRAKLGAVADMQSDAVDLPDMFLDLLVKVTCMILENKADTDVLMSEVSRMADELIPARRYSNVKQRMPFIC